MADKKYYWLKLKKDFFKRHDIQIIENMPNGKDYVLFYLKLLVESVDHNGGLRFNETIPYNEQMLATITNTNIDTVSKAMELFRSLGMVEILDDQTIYMNEVSKMLGAETYWAEKKREQRQKAKLNPSETPQIGHCPSEVQTVQAMSKVEIEKEIDIELDKDIEKEKDKKKKKKPANADFASLISSYTSNPDLIQTIRNFIEHRKEIKHKLTEQAMKLALAKLDKLASSDEMKIEIINQSIERGYRGLFPLDDSKQRGYTNAKPIQTHGDYDSSGRKLL